MQKLLPPTLAEFEDFLRLVGEWYREPEIEGAESWQRAAARHICEHSHAIFQGPRQWFGKTWVVSRYVACCLYRGLNCLVSYPTQGQGEQIMIDRVDGVMVKLERKGLMKRKKPDNVRLKKWDSPYGEVQLKVLSLSEGAKSGTQGFTADCWFCDEAQETLIGPYEAVEPAIDIADKEGRAKIVLLGVGGNTVEHLIECKKPLEDKTWREPGVEIDEDEPETPFVARRFTTEDIIAVSPSFGPWYAKKQRNMSPQSWRQNYDCLPLVEGTGHIFPILEAEVKPFSASAPHYFEFGIDVGRTSNSTIVVCMRCQGEVSNCIDILQVPHVNFAQQALEVAEWIRRYPHHPSNVRIERNTIGWGLYDSLVLQPGFSAITPVETSDAPPDYEKSNWILRLQEEAIGYHPDAAMQRPRLGVRNSQVRLHLKRLMYEKKNTPRGVQHDWDLAGHSDVLAALWVWVSQRQAGAFAG